MELAIGIFFGVLGAIPIIIDYELYLNKIKIIIASDDLIFENLHITFDIISKEKIDIYQTCKIKVKKENAKLKLGHYNHYGPNENSVLKIDNRPIENEYVKKDDIVDVMTYTIYNKSRGENLIFEDSFTATLDEKEMELNDDGCGTKLEYHKCKNLVLHIIYPRDFIPCDLLYTESIVKNDIEKVKIKSNKTKHLAAFKDERKQILWTINYPKYKHKYSINWKWHPV
jgi:hypothetical protein